MVFSCCGFLCVGVFFSLVFSSEMCAIARPMSVTSYNFKTIKARNLRWGELFSIHCLDYFIKIKICSTMILFLPILASFLTLGISLHPILSLSLPLPVLCLSCSYPPPYPEQVAKAMCSLHMRNRLSFRDAFDIHAQDLSDPYFQPRYPTLPLL